MWFVFCISFCLMIKSCCILYPKELHQNLTKSGLLLCLLKTFAERQLLAKLLLDGRANPDKDFIHYVILIGIQRGVYSLKAFACQTTP